MQKRSTHRSPNSHPCAQSLSPNVTVRTEPLIKGQPNLNPKQTEAYTCPGMATATNRRSRPPDPDGASTLFAPPSIALADDDEIKSTFSPKPQHSEWQVKGLTCSCCLAEAFVRRKLFELQEILLCESSLSVQWAWPSGRAVTTITSQKRMTSMCPGGAFECQCPGGYSCVGVFIVY